MNMKYKDYLILPMFIMSLIFTSCKLVSESDPSNPSNAPDAELDPQEIVWGCDENGYGEYWYADGARGAECFSVIPGGNGANEICFFSNSKGTSDAGAKGVRYKVDNMHMSCFSGGKSYDLIFLDEMTAYDNISGTYYQRADYNALCSALTSGKFVNKDNPNDWYVFKPTGKSIEYFGEKAFPGRWRLATSDTISVYDNKTKETFIFSIIFDGGGQMQGFRFDDIEYYLSI